MFYGEYWFLVLERFGRLSWVISEFDMIYIFLYEVVRKLRVWIIISFGFVIFCFYFVFLDYGFFNKGKILDDWRGNLDIYLFWERVLSFF